MIDIYLVNLYRITLGLAIGVALVAYYSALVSVCTFLVSKIVASEKDWPMVALVAVMILVAPIARDIFVTPSAWAIDFMMELATE